MKVFLRFTIAAAVAFQVPQPAFAQRVPIDGDGLDAIYAYCTENWTTNFASYDACTLYESQHYVPPANGGDGDYLMAIPLPIGGYVTYHYTS